MDTSDPEIAFDADGRCGHCTDFLENRAAGRSHGGTGREEIERLLDDVRQAGRDSRYDCVIGTSGGVDSSYLAYILTREFGLRPLAVHMDNGWDTADSVRNIRALVDGLGLGYECCVLDWDEFRRIQLAFLRASVPEAETPTDVAIPETLHSVAERHGIRYILGGGNIATEGILPRAWHYNARDRKYFNSICKRFGAGQPTQFKFYDYRRELYYKLAKGIKTIYPLNYLPFSKDDAIALLTDVLGFRYYGEKHHESRYCRFVQSYYLFKKFGIDYRRATYSSMIMDGRMERSEALAYLDELPYRPENEADDLRYVAKKLEISVAELDAIVAEPPTWYWDHPNDEAKLAFIYGAYRKLYGKKGVASV